MKVRSSGTAVVLATFLFMILILGSETVTSACHKKTHDCGVRRGRASIRGLPFRVAQTMDLFSKQGVYPEIVVDDNGARLASIVDGSALIALASPAEVPRLLEVEKRIKIIAGLQTRPSGFLVTADIREVKFLKGRKLGVVDARSDDAAYARIILSRAGLGKDDYSLEPVPAARSRLDAVKGGQISAAVLEGPLAFEAQQRGMVVTPLAELVPLAAETVIIGRQDQLEAEIKGVTAVLRVLRDAVAWIYQPQNRSEVLGMIQKEYAIPNEVATFVYERLIAKTPIYSRDLAIGSDLLKATNEWLGQVGMGLKPEFLEDKYLKAAGIMK